MSKQVENTKSQATVNSKVYWRDEFTRRLKQCEQRPIRYPAEKTVEHTPYNNPEGPMEEEGVILAIAAVWRGLINAGTRFAFGNTYFFSKIRVKRMVGFYAVGGPGNLVMPLVFDGSSNALLPEGELDTVEQPPVQFSTFQKGEEHAKAVTWDTATGKGPGNKDGSHDTLEPAHSHQDEIGHFILAIAERLGENGDVRMRFMDSSPGNMERENIRFAARNIVRNSGWLGDSWPRFSPKEEEWEDVIRQNGNNHGEHCVLNAWAYMLNIPLVNNRRLNYHFYTSARKMIKCALNGQLDSLAIRAFMQHYGYAVHLEPTTVENDESQNPNHLQGLRAMQSVAMNQHTLNRIVEEMHAEEVIQTTTEAQQPPSKPNMEVAQGPAGERVQRNTDDQYSPEAGLPPSVSPYSHSWTQEYQRRLEHYETLTNTDFINAIAAVWCGLLYEGMEFSFGNSRLLLDGRIAPGKDRYAVQGPETFIFPIILDEESDALGPEALARVEPRPLVSPNVPQRGEQDRQAKKQPMPRRHMVLAIASMKGPGTSDVHLLFMDSLPNKESKGIIRRVARNIVRNSGWLGDKWPKFETETWARVPGQRGNLSDKGGEHTVLNAWSYMLNLPLSINLILPDTAVLYDQVRIMITCALRGRLDCSTIRAFMHHIGYIRPQSIVEVRQNESLETTPTKGRNKMRCVAMTEHVLASRVYCMQKYRQETRKKGNGGHQVAASVPQPTGRAPVVSSKRQRSGSPVTNSKSPIASRYRDEVVKDGPEDPSTAKTWQEILDRGLARHRHSKGTRKKTSRGGAKEPLFIKGFSNLTDDEVVTAIATVWEGLRRHGRKYAYAGLDIFASAGTGGEPLEGFGVVGGQNAFIMPLLINSERSHQGKKIRPKHNKPAGHLLLGVAELESRDEPIQKQTVRIRYFDSLPGSVSSQDIENAAIGTVRRSNWLGTDASNQPISPKSYARTDIPVPWQPDGTNACGIYLILNAWAYMLHIPIHPGRDRRQNFNLDVFTDTDEFLETDVVLESDFFLLQALEIINLALSGNMDSRTIQAFLNVYGYSAPQDPNNEGDSVVEVPAIGMNAHKLLLTGRRVREQEERLVSATQQQQHPTDEQVAQLLEFGVDHRLSTAQVQEALIFAKGNMEEAHARLENTPALALSPQTPKQGKYALCCFWVQNLAILAASLFAHPYPHPHTPSRTSRRDMYRSSSYSHFSAENANIVRIAGPSNTAQTPFHPHRASWRQQLTAWISRTFPSSVSTAE